jgi:hypothetical protein
MAGGKQAPEGKSEPFHKRTAIDLEIKIRMIHKYEGGQSLSALACGHCDRWCSPKRTCEMNDNDNNKEM